MFLFGVKFLGGTHCEFVLVFSPLGDPVRCQGRQDTVFVVHVSDGWYCLRGGVILSLVGYALELVCGETVVQSWWRNALSKAVMSCISDLSEELWCMIFEFSELGEVVCLGWTCRRLRESIGSYLSLSEAWKGRVPPCYGLEVSDRVGGYFHYNEGEMVSKLRVLSKWVDGRIDILFKCSLLLQFRMLTTVRVKTKSCLFVVKKLDCEVNEEGLLETRRCRRRWELNFRNECRLLCWSDENLEEC